MRSRLTLALVALSLTVTEVAAAQMVGRAGRGRRPTPTEMPPRAPGIPDAMAYTRYKYTRFSLEQYPMLSYFSTVGMAAPGIPSSFWSFGDGLHVGFRVAPSLSMTLDATSSIFGGPFSMGTADFGLRVKPWTSPRFKPFADARVSYGYTSGAGAGSNAVPFMFMYRAFEQDFSSSSGRGLIFGLGAETLISPRWALTTSLAATQYKMNATNMFHRNNWDYTANTTRLAVGLKYNHGRWLDPR